jgi:RimJ/RimL family protein N-acetyltransferase
MVTVRTSEFRELNEFSKMNVQNHVGNHLNIKTLKEHQQEFKSDNIIFLSIFIGSNQLVGCIILVKKNSLKNIQFKRILVDENYLGIGQKAIIAMENYCITKLKTDRVWLDVFNDNRKAIHIYEKLGYKLFKQDKEGFRTVLFYEKKF